MTQLETTEWLYGTIATHGAGDLISDCIQEYGEWARAEVEFICKYLLPHQGTFIDIGAFIGTHTIPFALHVGPGGKGISFEPHQSSFSLLSANLQMAGLKNVTAYNTAASESSGIAFNLFSEPGNNGQTTLHREAATDNRANTDSNQCLSQAIDDLHLGHVDFIKADVEGMERSVLNGCIKLIEDCKPNIYLELNSLEEHAFALEFAKKFDYQVYGVRILAFNNSNYKKNLNNEALGNGAELGIVLTTDNLPELGNSPEESLIAQRLNDLDELALFLLSKPQYRSRLSNGFLAERLGTPKYLASTLTTVELGNGQEHSTEIINQLNSVRDESARSRDALLAQMNRTLESERQTREEFARSRDALHAQMNRTLESERQAREEATVAKSLLEKALSDLNEQKAMLDEATQSRDSLLAQLKAIVASRSWALTGPYRKLASYIRSAVR